jgi:hypothetical protein
MPRLTTEQIKKRAEDHFDYYVGPMQKEMLEAMVEVCLKMSRFHYITSHVHGAKHEREDAKELQREAFNNERKEKQ